MQENKRFFTNSVFFSFGLYSRCKTLITFKILKTLNVLLRAKSNVKMQLNKKLDYSRVLVIYQRPVSSQQDKSHIQNHHLEKPPRQKMSAK